ncbi:EGF-like domain containing protein [Cryptosporidium tyzzeri]|nr:EGF-like domain containing protein [Cryptosporidium tyzzeri]
MNKVILYRKLLLEFIFLIILLISKEISCEDFISIKEYNELAKNTNRGGIKSNNNNNNIKEKNAIGPKITWMPKKKLYLCDNYHFSVTTPNSFIYPELEIKIIESTLTQGFTIFLRCGNLATPYNYDTRIDIPSGINKGTIFGRKLPLCNFPLLDNNAYNIDIYIGDVDIEFTRRHYCPCSSQYVILSIGCLVEYNNNEIMTLSPSSEYSLTGPINNKKDNIKDSSKSMINSNNLPLNNLKIFSTPVCILENDFVTICNAVLQFSIQIGEINNNREDMNNKLIDNISHNFCIYLSPYYWNDELLDKINKNNQLTFDKEEKNSNIKDSLASIPLINDHLNSPFSPNICIDLNNELSDNLIKNENLPPQLRSNVDSISMKLVRNDSGDNNNKNDPKMIKVNLILNNIKPSKYFIYPFLFQYNTRSNIDMGISENSNINSFNMKFFYDLNYTQLTGDPFIVKWLTTRVDPNYKLETMPRMIESEKLDMNIKLNEPFYIVIPKIKTNILSFESNNLFLYISNELLYLFDRYNCSLIIDYIGLLGRFPVYNENNYNLIKDYELKETKIFNTASEPRIIDNSIIQIANISIPLSTINNNLPFAFKMNIKTDIKPMENIPVKSINIRLKHHMIPKMCKASTCSGHGDCSLVEYSGNINIYCSCYPGWGGFYCSYPYLSSQSILAYPITLVGTNFVAIPTILVCIFKKKWLVAFLAFIAGLISSIFHAAEVGLLVDHEDMLLKGDLISAQLIISFVFILLCRFNYKVEISLLFAQIIVLVLLTLLTSRLVTTVIPLMNCFTILLSRIIYWYNTTKLYSEKIPSNISCTIPIELTNTLNTPTNLISKDNNNSNNSEELKKSPQNSSNCISTCKYCQKNSSASQFDISKVDDIAQNPNSARNLNSPVHSANNFLTRLQYSIINGYKKLIFIFDREYYSPRHILIGFIMGTIGCITWFLETVDTYWFFHSIWHIMAFLASTFIIHGCVPPKIHLFPSKSHDFTFNRKIGQTNISNNKAGLEKPVEFADGVINVELK